MFICYYVLSNKYSMSYMNTGKDIFFTKNKNGLLKAFSGGNIYIAGLSSCILIVLICLLVLVGILS